MSWIGSVTSLPTPAQIYEDLINNSDTYNINNVNNNNNTNFKNNVININNNNMIGVL